MIREVKLGDILEYEQPNMYIVKNTNYDKKFSTPVLTAGQTFILGYTNEKENIFKAKENPVIIFDDFTTASKYVDFDFKVKSSAMKILKAREGINIKYIYYAMKNIKFDNQLHKRYWISEYSKIKLLIPDIKMQEKIVKELDLINKLVDYKKKQIELFDDFIKSQFVEMFGNPIINDKKFEFKQIGEVTKIVTGTTPDTNDVENWNGGINWITPAEIKEDTLYVYETERKITEKGQKSKSLTLMPKGTVIFSTRAPIGKTAIVGTEMCCNQGFKNCICSSNINNIYLYYVLKNNTIYFNNLGTGATFKELSKRVFEKVKISVPPIDLQNQFSEIVKQIDKQKFESMIQLKMMEKIYNIINDRRRYV
jgi:type-1 restriction enzyme ecoR124II specificity protein